MTHEERKVRRAKVAEDIKGGMTIELASKKHGVSASTVMLSCLEQGVRPTTSYSPKPTTAFVILKHLLDGDSQVDTAKKLGVTRQRVNDVAKSASNAGFNLK